MLPVHRSLSVATLILLAACSSLPDAVLGGRALDERVVHGVRSESNAFEAGLRDGQGLLGMSLYHGDLEREVRLDVREGDEQRTICYLPLGDVQPIPQLRRSEVGSADCDWLWPGLFTRMCGPCSPPSSPRRRSPTTA